MRPKLSLFACFLLLSLLVSASGISAQEASQVNPANGLASPLSTAFTYQGRLEDSSGPVDNHCDFEFNRIFIVKRVGRVNLTCNLLSLDRVFRAEKHKQAA